MCLLSFYPAGVEVDPEPLRIAAESNPDGFGFAVIKNRRRIVVRKSMDSDKLIDQFIKARKRHIEAPALFHCRLTTDGMTGTYNNHPFTVVNPKDPSDVRTIMAHNGIFPNEARPGKGDIRSDTRIVAEEMAATLWDLKTPEGRLAFGDWMGSGSKVVLMTIDPAFGANAFIINGHVGTWDNGVWYSNNSYRWARASYAKDWRYVGGDGGGAWYAVSSRDDYRPSHMYQDCQVCDKKNTVHNLTLFCASCGTCNQCWFETRDCRCAPYWKELEQGNGTWERESVTVSERLTELDDLIDEMDDSIVEDDGTIVWPKVLGPGPMPSGNGWPEDLADPMDDADDTLTRELKVLVAHVNNGGEI